MSIIHRIGDALLMAAGMAWEVGWSLVLGFVISGILQVLVSRDRIGQLLGRDGLREIAIATAFGAASSSCSYASASITRTMFQKGAALAPSLAFLFSSTNLVVELGIVLYLLMGWQFMAAEWVGGILLVAIMTLLVKATYPERLVEAARNYARQGQEGGHDHASMGGSTTQTLSVRLRRRETWIAVSQSFVMDLSMLWKDLLTGFLIAGFLSVFVPHGVWKVLFVSGAPPWLQMPANALLGPLIAVISFVCSIGNVPLAAILWGSGISFGGVLAFLYADLIVFPLLDVYRRYFGWRMAVYIALVFYSTMVLAALAMDLAFHALGIVPRPTANLRAAIMHFSIDATFWLNLGFGGLAVWLAFLARRHPAKMENHCAHHDQL